MQSGVTSEKLYNTRYDQGKFTIGGNLNSQILVVGLWCLMPLSTIFHLHRGGQFYLWRTPKYTEKITNLFVEIGNNLHR
jgi:hypothetical protein